MPLSRVSGARFAPGLPFVLLAALLCSLWLAGGASRADALGQAIVRAAATITFVAAVLLCDRPQPGRALPVVWLLAVAIILPVAQLIPLPPAVWQSLPGRAMFEQAASLSGQTQPWRPWSIVPDSTLNAACSLIVPAAVLALATALGDKDRRLLPGLVLGLVAAAMLLGLLQFSGVRIDNPLINDTPGEVGGNFANRNHFALFLAIGCLVAPVWTFLNGRPPRWRAPLAAGLVVLFVLTILATGSRAGLVLGILALAMGLGLVRRDLKHALRRYPRWAFPALIVGIIGVIVVVVLGSIAADRAVSISRAIAIDPGQDMRSRGLPTVLQAIGAYFPMGTGLGSFDPIFRLHEPLGLLKPTFFNHAHNEYLEVVLDAGLPGLLVLMAALSWWAWTSLSSLRSKDRGVLPGLGAGILLLVIVASVSDYPARTPMIMAVLVIAALWLSEGGPVRPDPALPEKSQVL